jgi:hypothetical protein
MREIVSLQFGPAFIPVPQVWSLIEFSDPGTQDVVTADDGCKSRSEYLRREGAAHTNDEIAYIRRVDTDFSGLNTPPSRVTKGRNQLRSGSRSELGTGVNAQREILSLRLRASCAKRPGVR